MLAAQLAEHPTLCTVLIDAKPGPLAVGQADGVSGRSLEIFHAMGFANRVLEEAYQLRALSFWRYDDADPTKIVRRYKQDDGRVAFSRFPHVVLNQARVHDFMLEGMANAPAGLTPHYSTAITGIEESSHPEYPLTVSLLCVNDGGEQRRSLGTRYLVGCDGAHSLVRKSQGLPMRGESSSKAWGVMDLLLVTDFPDIRTKSIVESANHGTLMIIPREGGHLVRFYVELEQAGLQGQIDRSAVTLEQLIEAAAAILKPFEISVKEVPWWSVYEVGQRVCDVFDDRGQSALRRDHPRVFIAGDACHTHSPKAGQGMNVSMHDAHNLGWKLAAVAKRQCDPRLLLTYSDERRRIAQELIDFDQHLAGLFSAPTSARDDDQRTALQEALLQADAYVSGTLSHYPPSMIVSPDQLRMTGWHLETGKRLAHLPVLRAADARPMAINDKLLADGRWRVLLAPRPDEEQRPGELGWRESLNAAALWWQDNPNSPILRYTPAEGAIDSVIELLALVPDSYDTVEWRSLAAILWPAKGELGLRDYGKVFTLPDGRWSVEQEANPRSVQGVCVLIRPDQHIAAVYALEDTAAPAQFFANFMHALS